MRVKFFTLLFCVSIFYLISITGKAVAYPRFAAYTGDKCMDCHVNPNGGTMRNSGGIGFAKNSLNMKLFEKLVGKTDFSPQITKVIAVGGDVRVAQVNDQNPGRPNLNSFLSMQGDLYVNAELNKILNVFVTSGISIPGIETLYEVYGMISKLPANLYFKVGRYKPNYGIKIVEHRAYQRLYLLNTPYDANTGFEVGVSPGWFNMSVGLFNPLNSTFLGLVTTSPDPHKMVVASTDANFGFKDNNFNVDFGASFFNDPYNTNDTTGTAIITAVKQAWGGNTRIGIIKRISLLGEIDWEQMTSDKPMVRSLFGYGELNFIIIKGLELRTQYEYYDRNRDVTDDDVTRLSGGIAAFPFFGFETEFMLRFPIETPKVDNNELQWNFHFYF